MLVLVLVLGAVAGGVNARREARRRSVSSSGSHHRLAVDGELRGAPDADVHPVAPRERPEGGGRVVGAVLAERSVDVHRAVVSVASHASAPAKVRGRPELPQRPRVLAVDRGGGSALVPVASRLVELRVDDGPDRALGFPPVVGVRLAEEEHRDARVVPAEVGELPHAVAAAVGAALHALLHQHPRGGPTTRDGVSQVLQAVEPQVREPVLDHHPGDDAILYAKPRVLLDGLHPRLLRPDLIPLLLLPLALARGRSERPCGLGSTLHRRPPAPSPLPMNLAEGAKFKLRGLAPTLGLALLRSDKSDSLARGATGAGALGAREPKPGVSERASR